LVSVVAGSNQVTATVDGKSTAAKESVFVADSTTAVIAAQDTDFMVATGAVADGVDENAVSARVTDAKGNPVAGMAVSFAVTGDATLVASNAMTNEQGVARSALVSVVAGSNNYVTATANDKSTAPKRSSFVADITTAALSQADLTVVRDNAVADGVDANVVKVVVKDAQGNPVEGVEVTFNATDGAVVAAIGATDRDGAIEMPLTSTNVGPSTVTASIDGSSVTETLTFRSMVVVSLGYDSGPVYTQVTGAASDNPIVGSFWRARLTCSAAVPASDCDASKFDFTWMARGADGVTRPASGATNSEVYMVPANEQRAQIWVEITPKASIAE
ncbi:Ig-like domain-containing protein, partial [Aeromonas veronii]